jgi:hypothetical protein
LEKIDKRLSQLHNNPYQSREMSVFWLNTICNTNPI